MLGVCDFFKSVDGAKGNSGREFVGDGGSTNKWMTVYYHNVEHDAEGVDSGCCTVDAAVRVRFL